MGAEREAGGRVAGTERGAAVGAWPLTCSASNSQSWLVASLTTTVAVWSDDHAVIREQRC